MKTRIVYPQLWLDEKFAECKITSKLLFVYLITSPYLGLSVYSRISDRKILFDTGLNTVQLREAKDELEKLGWCIFKNEWIYQKHKCAYVDYAQNDRVLISKQKEIDAVPDEIKQYFNDFCLNKVETGLQRNTKYQIPNINILNKGGVGENKPTEEVAGQIAYTYKVPISFVFSKWDDLENYCLSTGKRYKDYTATLKNWVKKDAIERIDHANIANTKRGIDASNL